MSMRTTPFPSKPCEVAVLTVPEFTFELDLNAPVSLEIVCRRFLDDANRALVWFIRARALTAWCKRADVAGWLRANPSHSARSTQLQPKAAGRSVRA